VDDEIYHAARVEAAKRRTSLSAMVRNSWWADGRAEEAGTELEKLWAMSDRKHAGELVSRSLNREQLTNDAASLPRALVGMRAGLFGRPERRPKLRWRNGGKSFTETYHSKRPSSATKAGPPAARDFGDQDQDLRTLRSIYLTETG